MIGAVKSAASKKLKKKTFICEKIKNISFDERQMSLLFCKLESEEDMCMIYTGTFLFFIEKAIHCLWISGIVNCFFF